MNIKKKIIFFPIGWHNDCLYAIFPGKILLVFFSHYILRDMPGCMSRQEVDFLFRLEEILDHAQQKIQVLELSAREGQSLSDVAHWLQDNCKPNS